MTAQPPSRAYDNRARAAAAQITRRRLVEAAHALFLDRGFGGTTVKDVAERAGVSVETVYKAFGGKAALLKAVYDVVLAGDDDARPMAARTEFLSVATERDPRRQVRGYAELAGLLSQRLGPLLAVLLASRGADPVLDDFARTIDGERRVGATMFVSALEESGGLRTGLSPERAADAVWTLNSPAVFLLLHQRGWSIEEYVAWLERMLVATLLADPDREASDMEAPDMETSDMEAPDMEASDVET